MRSEVASGSEMRSSAALKPVRGRKRVVVFGIILVTIGVAIFLLSRAGAFLIMHAPERSDVIVVLDGEWPKAVELQKEGYATTVLLDAGVNRAVYGRTEIELARELLHSEKLARVELCPVTASTTFAEAADVQGCLQPLHPGSVLLVASNFDTRRALEIFRKRLPQYRWSMAASSAPFHFADQYWKHRSWAKTVLNAWEQYLWWKLVDQWRSDVALR
jgi:uncharacterized SAM-binding protein YcdF (DUF218 family)